MGGLRTITCRYFIRIGDMGNSMWGFYFLGGEANELCDLTVLGKVVKQLVACKKCYLVRLFAGDEKGFDCVIAFAY